jgi:CheY-like chemotaxis protein
MTTAPDILVIEDDAILREALTDWLRAAGYQVRAAAEGGAGLAAVKMAAPALVVTDMHMPGTSGAAIISELKRDYPQVAIIAISGLFNSGHGLDAAGALELGAARALTKPFKRAELLRAIGEILGHP